MEFQIRLKCFSDLESLESLVTFQCQDASKQILFGIHAGAPGPIRSSTSPSKLRIGESVAAQLTRPRLQQRGPSLRRQSVDTSRGYNWI